MVLIKVMCIVKMHTGCMNVLKESPEKSKTFCLYVNFISNISLSFKFKSGHSHKTGLRFSFWLIPFSLLYYFTATDFFFFFINPLTLCLVSCLSQNFPVKQSTWLHYLVPSNYHGKNNSPAEIPHTPNLVYLHPTYLREITSLKKNNNPAL